MARCSSTDSTTATGTTTTRGSYSKTRDPLMSYGEELARLQMLLGEENKSNSQLIMFVENNQQSHCVNAVTRDRMCEWLHKLTRELRYSSEVFYRSASLLDAFLSTYKVQEKFVCCATASCFVIAVKLQENISNDSVGKLQASLVDRYSSPYRKQDIQNMELVIRKRLETNFIRPTVQDFIRSFHSLALSSQLFQLPPHLSVPVHLNHLYQCAQYVVCCHDLMKHRPSMLALAVLGCDLKSLDCDWLSVILSLETLVQVRGGELSVCYEAVAAKYPGISMLHPLPTPPQPPPKPPRQKWREIVLGLPLDGDNEDEGEEGPDIERQRKTKRRSHRRRYRPPLCRTVNVAIV